MSRSQPKLTDLFAPYKVQENTMNEEPKTGGYPEHIQRLLRIHSYKRPHGSKTVDEFVEKFLLCYPDAYLLEEGKEPLAVVISTSDASRTMFSAHVDTVHQSSGRQVLRYDHEMALLSKPQDNLNDKECLGADDGAGIWLLLEMIDAGIPGTYVFHYGEERGGIGSSAIAECMPTWLNSFDRAIAFDRKGTGDVITHQGWTRCCSDKFADELARQLNSAGQSLSFSKDDGGIFTDTANYVTHISECTNLSCGYEGAHTNGEMLDVEFLLNLREAVLQVEWEDLPVVRDPTVEETTRWDYGGWESKYGKYYESWYEKDAAPAPAKKGKSKPVDANRLLEMRFGELKNWILAEDVSIIADAICEVQDMYFEVQDQLVEAEEELKYLRKLHGTSSFLDDDDGDDGDRLDVGLR